MSHEISLAIITLNEEKNIERCIRSVPFAKDIVVVDSGSTDRTVDLARRLGARVSLEPWRGFAKQKTRAAALCRNPWVLSLDADEALSEKAQAELQALLENDLKFDAYRFSRRTHHMGTWLRHGESYPDSQIRLFHKDRAKWSEAEVNESIVAQSVGDIGGDILHWPFPQISDQIATINRYSSLMAKDWHQRGQRFHLSKLVLAPVFKFFRAYVLKRGFLDGMAGLQTAVVRSFSDFLLWIKLYEIQKQKSLGKKD